MYTINLYDVINKFGRNIFPNYSFNNIAWFDKEITKEDFENMLIDYYANYEIGFETIEMFIFEFKRIFNREFPTMYEQLKLQSKITYDLLSYNHSYQVTDKNDNKYSDTPNEPLTDVGGSELYLTTRTLNDNEKSIIDNMKLNDIERFNDVYYKIRNIIYEFFDKFDDLFLKIQVIKTVEV